MVSAWRSVREIEVAIGPEAIIMAVKMKFIPDVKLLATDSVVRCVR